MRVHALIILPLILGSCGSNVPSQLHAHEDSAGGMSVGAVSGSEAEPASYPRTPAETAAGVLPEDRHFPPGDARRYGARLDGATADTGAYRSSLLQAYQSGGADPYWPAGTAVVESLVITGAVHIQTAGFATILRQKSDQAAGTPILRVLASNVAIGRIQFRGNIESDQGEHSHAIEVGGTENVSNFTLEGVRAQDIRGDVLYLGGTINRPLQDVQIGDVEGSNIYRSVVSVTGGVRIRIASITGNRVGYRHLDVEPNPGGSQEPDDIEVGSIRGADIQFAGDGHIPIGTVRVAYANLDNSRVSNSSPGYPSYPGANGFAAIVANTHELRFGTLRVRGFRGPAIHCPRVAQASSLYIEHLDAESSRTDASLVNAEGLQRLEINGRDLFGRGGR
jgi:hypothetical protein